jgi:hypothetical protein
VLIESPTVDQADRFAASVVGWKFVHARIWTALGPGQRPISTKLRDHRRATLRAAQPTASQRRSVHADNPPARNCQSRTVVKHLLLRLPATVTSGRACARLIGYQPMTGGLNDRRTTSRELDPLCPTCATPTRVRASLRTDHAIYTVAKRAAMCLSAKNPPGDSLSVRATNNDAAGQRHIEDRRVSRRPSNDLKNRRLVGSGNDINTA